MLVRGDSNHGPGVLVAKASNRHARPERQAITFYSVSGAGLYTGLLVLPCWEGQAGGFIFICAWSGS